jgi:ribulose-phosphate 3-epimerase
MAVTKVAPSILSADILHLEDEIKAIERDGADLIHIDIMDGHFVPNLTFGPDLVKGVKSIADLPLDVHLMIDNPQVFIERFAKAGADNITVHSEVTVPIPQLFEIAKSFDKSFGVSIKPDTSLESIAENLELLDMLLIMTVYPGFGGQEFIESTLPTIEKAAKLKRENGFKYHIEVDGGLNDVTVKKAAGAGAEVIVAGNYIFKSKDYKRTMDSLKVAVD